LQERQCGLQRTIRFLTDQTTYYCRRLIKSLPTQY
jgi:hypothetical protein